MQPDLVRMKEEADDDDDAQFEADSLKCKSDSKDSNIQVTGLNMFLRHGGGAGHYNRVFKADWISPG